MLILTDSLQQINRKAIRGLSAADIRFESLVVNTSQNGKALKFLGIYNSFHHPAWKIKIKK